MILAGVLATVAGFVVHRMWLALPAARFFESLLLPILACGLAWPLRRISRCSWATAFALVWLATLTVWTGAGTVLATAMLALAACATGLAVVPSMAARAAVSTAVGLAVIAAVAGWTLRWPVHHQVVWLALLAGIILLRQRALRAALAEAASAWREQVAQCPAWAAAAVMLLGLATVACWLPTLQADDVVYHLGLPHQLLANARYLPQPGDQVWALAPWAGDTLHGIVMVIARVEARGALNALWIGLGAIATWSFAAGLGATAPARWASACVFATLPLLAGLAGGMQTELPATALLLALAALVMAPDGQRRWIAIAILTGGLAALKAMHLLSALPLLAYGAWRHRKVWRWRCWPLTLLLVAVVGSSSYVHAWLHTGNPVLPLFNATFHSPYFPAQDFDDARWHAGFDWLLPWQLVFDTSRYFENGDGAFGFVPVMLAGAWWVALLRRDLRLPMLAATCAVLLPLLPLQYARYAFPGLALSIPLLLVAASGALARRAFIALVALLCLANLAFQANGHWLLGVESVKRYVKSGGDAFELYRRFLPERALLSQLPAGDRHIVLATDPARPFVAELGLRGRNVAWYSPRFEVAREAADADASGAAWMDLFCRSGAGWLLVTPAQASPGLQAALAKARAGRRAQVSDAQLWQLPGPGTCSR